MSTQKLTSKRRVLFIVPYKNRDFEGLALIGYLLETYYGFDVVYTNGYSIERKLLEIKPDAVVFDHLVWDFKVHQARLARGLGMKVILLPTEGLHVHVEEGLRIAGKLSASTHLIDCHFTWGDIVRDAILGDQLSPEHRVHAVGCPRFDFYSAPFQCLTPDRDTFLAGLGIKNYSAPVILWCTSSSYSTRDQQKIVQRYAARGGIPEQECAAMLRDGQTQLHSHSQVVLDLASRHPDWNFVIKVHPAEWINPYVELAKQRPNVFLGYNAPIRGFLAHSEALLQRGCTTATEAWMLGKPVLELAIGNYERPVRQDLVAGNHVVTTIDEADRALQHYLDGAGIPVDVIAAREAFLHDFCLGIDGKAASRCASLIARTVSPPDHADSDHALMLRLATKAHADLVRAENRRLTNRFKDAVGISRDRSLRIWKTVLNTESKHNVGLFVAETDITPDMVRDTYAAFSRVPFGESLGPDSSWKPHLAATVA
jgi:surface carbohydrate biosynthesis protein